jgi:hypothetical protein
MTIREKLCIPIGKFYTETSKELEEIADDYAIDFVEWICKNYETDAIVFGILDTKELLEIFKKEKGL